MTLNIEEYERRVAWLKSEMSTRGLDALLFYGWKRGQIRYISGYYPNYIANVAVVIIPREGETAMRIRFPFDLERARTSSWIKNIAASGNLLNFAPDCARILEGNHIVAGRVGLVTGDSMMDEMPRSLFTALSSLLPGVTWCEASDLLIGQRLIKITKEYDLLRASAHLADMGAEAARQAIQPGRTEYEVVACAEAEMRRSGADDFLVVIASKGDKELIGPPEHKYLEMGDNVIFEIAVKREGYWTQVARVFYVGAPSPAQRKMYMDTLAAFRYGLEIARPGITCQQISDLMATRLIQDGYDGSIEQDFGHGIGLDLPEPPRIDKDDVTVLREGMVLVIHPAVRKFGVGGAFIGGTVLIHSDRAELINVLPDTP